MASEMSDEDGDGMGWDGMSNRGRRDGICHERRNGWCEADVWNGAGGRQYMGG